MASARARRAAASSRAGLLAGAVELEQGSAGRDLSAARHVQRLEPAGDRRPDVDVLAFDVALNLQGAAVAAEPDRRGERDQRSRPARR